MNQRKVQRLVQAAVAAGERRRRQVESLTAALLRSKVLLEAWFRAGQAIDVAHDDDALIEASRVAFERVEISPMVRLETASSVHLALLHAVVEKWRQWKFQDPEVDRLLRHRFAELLERHRHAIFHADYIDAPDCEAAFQEPQVLAWALELADALAEHLRSWHSNEEARMREYLATQGWR